MKLKKGRRYRLFFRKRSPCNRTFHVRAVVDKDWYAVREWSHDRRCWLYTLEHVSFMEMMEKLGALAALAG